MTIKIIYNTKHPLAESLAKLSHSYCYKKSFDFNQLNGAEIIFDLTLFTDEDKTTWLEKLTSQYKVITDASCNWGEFLEAQFSNLIGTMASAFYSPKSKCEVHLKDQNFKIKVDTFLANLNLTPHYVRGPGHGFTYPRTLSTLINEAYFALEDGLATREDMDQAMNFGVNYPHGLFEWSEKVGHTPVLMLLRSLYGETGDPRYRGAPFLTLESLKLNF